VTHIGHAPLRLARATHRILSVAFAVNTTCPLRRAVPVRSSTRPYVLPCWSSSTPADREVCCDSVNGCVSMHLCPGFNRFGDSLSDWSILNNDNSVLTKKGKVLPYLLAIVGLGADPGVQAVSPQVTSNHPFRRYRLPLLSARPVANSRAFTRWRHSYTVAHIRFQPTTHLSTLKG